MTEKLKKRFIAGAVCPKCQATDSIMLYWQNNVEQLECVQCGYHDSQTDSQTSKASHNQNVIGVFKP